LQKRLTNSDHINALELFDSPPVSSETFARSGEVLKANFGIDFDPVKFKALFLQIDNAGWTEERYRRTFDWFLRNKKFASWTIADFFEYGIEMGGYGWYLKKLHEGWKNTDFARWELPDGSVAYTAASADLPFKQWEPKAKTPIFDCRDCGKEFSSATDYHDHLPCKGET